MKLIVVLSAIFLSASAFGQTSAQKLAHKLESLQGFSSAFTQRVQDIDGEVLQQGLGQLDLVQPDKFRWHLQQPDESLLISNGKEVWFYDPFVEQASVYDYQYMLASNPILLLLQPKSQTWDSYTVKQLKEQTFRVESLDEQSQVSWLEVEFDGQRLIQLMIQDRQMQKSVYQFTQFKQQSLSDYQDGYFSFSLPEGAELDDQRAQ